MKNKILFYDKYFQPSLAASSQLLTGIVSALDDENIYIINVIHSIDDYSKRNNVNEKKFNNTKVIQLKSPLNIKSRDSFFMQIWFYYKLFIHLLFNKYDLVLCMTVPPLNHIAVFCAKILKPSIKYLPIIQDIYPDGIKLAPDRLKLPNILYFIIDKIVCISLRNSELIITITPEMKETLIAKVGNSVNIEVIENFADPSISRLEIEKSSSRQPIVLYSGNMGEGHQFEEILTAARELPEYKFIFTGGGVKKPQIESFVNKYSVKNIEVGNFVPLSELNDHINNADICLLTLSNGWERVLLPCKFYGIVAAGKPILYVGPSSIISYYIEKYNIGLWFKPCCAPQEIVDLLKRTSIQDIDNYANNTFKLYTKILNYPNQMAKYKKLIRRSINES